MDSLSQHVAGNIGGGCTTNAFGTALSTAVVGGVVALMLEVNPDLTWRDVQAILVETSSTVSDNTDTSRTTNGGGFVHSNLYGYGIVNASAAVDAAETWESLCPEMMLVDDSGEVNLTIGDSLTEFVQSSITLSVENITNFAIESVVVEADIRHYSRGDLRSC